jgi:adhesin/invasin
MSKLTNKKWLSILLTVTMLAMMAVGVVPAFAASSASVSISVAGSVATATATGITSPDYSFYYTGNGVSGNGPCTSSNTINLSNRGLAPGTYQVKVMALSAADVAAGNWANAVWSAATPVTNSEQVTVTASGTVASAATTGVTNPYFLFFISQAGNDVAWTSPMALSTTATFDLSKAGLTAGSYDVVGMALDGTDALAAIAGSASAWNNAIWAPVVTIAVAPASVSAINPTIVVGGTTGFQFMNAAGTVVAAPAGVTFAVTGSNASTAFINSSNVFTATAAGTYTVTATFGSTVLSTTVAVAGQAAGVTLTAASATLIANGKSTDAITATVVDANGNAVPNFNGTATVGLTNNTSGSASIVTALGAQIVAAGGTGSVTFTNGVSTFYLLAPSASTTLPAKDVISVSVLASTNSQGIAANPIYTPVTVTYAAQSLGGLKVTAASSTLSANSNGNSDVLSISVIDSNGVTVTTVSPAVNATVTISGPGSFSQTSSLTTDQITISTGTNPNTLTVYPIQGQTGTITVTVSATGFTNASTTISSVITGAAASFNMASSTGTLTQAQVTAIGAGAVGQQYTAYTVSVVDASGNAVAAPNGDTLTLTTNNASLTTPGGLSFYALTNPAANPQVFTAVTPGIATASSLFLNTSTYTFYVFNSTVGSGNVTVTATESKLGLSQTGTYVFSAGAASQVDVAAGQGINLNLNPGGSSTLSFQLQDSSRNAVAQSGVSVYVWFGPVLNGVTVGANKVAPTTAATGYVATTNASGIATVPLNIAATTAAGPFAVSADISGSSSQLVAPIAGTVSMAVDTVTSIGFGTVASSVFTGASSLSFTAVATSGSNSVSFGSNNKVYTMNAVGTQIAGISGGDVLLMTISNKNVLNVTANGTWAAVPGSTTTYTALASLSGVPLPIISGMQAGTATITIADTSAATKPTVTLNVTVSVGAWYGYAFQYNGTAVTSLAKLAVAAGTWTPITVVAVDVGGNAVVVPAADSIVDVTDWLSNLNSASGDFSKTSGGVPNSQVTIPIGMQNATIYYMNPAGGNIYFSGTTAALGGVKVVSGAGSASSAYDITLQATDADGNALTSVSSGTVTIDLSTTGMVSINGATGASVTSSSNTVVNLSASGVATLAITGESNPDTLTVKNAGSTTTWLTYNITY